MHDKEAVLSLNGEAVLAPGHAVNGHADNDGSGSESGYTTAKKRRARRSSVKGAEDAGREKEKAPKPYSKQDAETSSQEMPGKAPHSRPNCTRTHLKPEAHAGARGTGARDTSPAAEAQDRNSDGKTSVSPVGKKTDERVGKAKPASSLSPKEDSWTLFKPPPVFPVDNSSAKIVPKISYASKVKENLNKPTQAGVETSKPSHVPMSAVKTVTSASFANIAPCLDSNGCRAPSSAAGVGAAPSASSNRAEEEEAESGGRCPSAPEPRKPGLFVYPHKPLNMQPAAARTNQKALGDIFQNRWGLSFINEPNAGPAGAPVSRPAAPFEISDVTFQGGNAPFVIRPSPNAVSLPAPQDARRATDAAAKPCPASRAAGQGCARARPARQQEGRAEDGESARNRQGPSKARGGAREWGWADLQAAVFYHTKGRVHLETVRIASCS